LPFTRKESIDQDSFERFLNWVNPNRTTAGERLLSIRKKLVLFFSMRRATNPDELADETIDRVIRHFQEGKEIYTAKPEAYVYGVAKNVFRESIAEKYRTLPVTEFKEESYPGDQLEKLIAREPDLEYECLRECLGHLSLPERDVFLRYYSEGRHAKAYREELSKDLGITTQTLMTRISRTKSKLRHCILECTKSKP
jgi:RNA polymerase sigma factor (sigma-70 family)